MNNKNDYITILMPVYNAQEFLRDAIDSILSQSYIDYEFLIIDDGSTDDSASIIRSYQDKRIRLISHEKNLGLQSTLNEGIRLASYDLIARMDADDISHPWRIEKQVAYMLAHPRCAMVDCWVKVMNKERNFIRAEGVYSKFVYYTLTFECCIYHPAVMYRKQAVQSVGGYKLPYAEDYDLFWQLSRRYKIHTIEEPLLWYRIHNQNLNTVVKRPEYDDYLQRVWGRNIAFYMGDKARLPASWIACYIYDFEPIIKEGDLAAICKCISYLDQISERMIAVENPNRHVDDIRYINNFKKQYIINGLASRLPFLKMWKLLIHYHQGTGVLKQTLKRGVKAVYRQS